MWSSHIGDQAQSAAFSPDGEAIVIGMSSGRWMVLDASTREIYGLQQVRLDPLISIHLSLEGFSFVSGGGLSHDAKSFSL